MSVEQMGMVWKLNLAPNKRLVLLAYADHADDDGANVYPSLGRVAHKTGYSRDQVRRISKELKDEKLMELVEPADPAKQRPAQYKLTLGNGKKLGPFKPKGGSGNMQPDPPTPPGANDPPPLGAPVPPEPSVEPSVTPTGESLDSSPSLTWYEMDTNQRQAYLIAYLHQRLKERDLLEEKPLTRGYKGRLAGELRREVQTGARQARLLFALDRIVYRWPERRLDWHDALNDADNDKVRHLRAVEDEKPKEGGGLESLSDKFSRLGITS